MAFNTTTSEIIPLSELEKYVVPMANYVEVDVSEGSVVTELQLRVCNKTDTNEMIFEPSGDDWTRDKLNDLNSFMLCLDDPHVVELEG